MDEPLISVIVPVYNGEKYISETIASILAQSYGNLEVLIVDDGSTDATAQTVQRIADPRLHYLHQPNSGAGNARNRGVIESQGAFIAFLDADDLWTSDKLASQMAMLIRQPQVDMLFGLYTEFLSPDLTVAELHHSPAMPGYSSCTMLIRRHAFFKAGFFSSEWRVGEFIDWYARAVDLGIQHEVLPQVVLHRRVHQTNSGIVQRHARVDYTRIVRAIIERRKRAKEEA